RRSAAPHHPRPPAPPHHRTTAPPHHRTTAPDDANECPAVTQVPLPMHRHTGTNADIRDKRASRARSAGTHRHRIRRHHPAHHRVPPRNLELTPTGSHLSAPRGFVPTPYRQPEPHPVRAAPSAGHLKPSRCARRTAPAGRECQLDQCTWHAVPIRQERQPNQCPRCTELAGRTMTTRGIRPRATAAPECRGHRTGPAPRWVVTTGGALAVCGSQPCGCVGRVRWWGGEASQRGRAHSLLWSTRCSPVHLRPHHISTTHTRDRPPAFARHSEFRLADTYDIPGLCRRPLWTTPSAAPNKGALARQTAGCSTSYRRDRVRCS
ncbi:hypothetical protein DFQ13_1161, partial [Actinokineospora spheciospongiae]